MLSRWLIICLCLFVAPVFFGPGALAACPPGYYASADGSCLPREVDKTAESSSSASDMGDYSGPATEPHEASTETAPAEIGAPASSGFGGLGGLSGSLILGGTSGMIGAKRSQPVAAYLGPYDTPIPTGRGYGVVILTKGAPYNERICETYLTTLRFQKAFTADNARKAQRAVYWPIVKAVPEPDQSLTPAQNCTAMLEAYDFPRATSYMLNFAQGNKITAANRAALQRAASRDGPFLVAYLDGDQIGTLYDFTDVPKDRLPALFRAFLQLMTQDATLWDRDHVEPEKLRDIVRRLVTDESLLALVDLILPTQALAKTK